ncbi:MAG: NAD(P)/FAD-dependent oxidoreductase, partial [Candidatus Puniceispirillum sp.]
MAKKIAVIGGGIVGVCSALDLQQAGYEVTLIDRKQPGRETSYGNAGVLSDSSVLVINNPSLLRRLPGLMRNQSTGLRYNPLFVLKRLPWVLKFLSYCTKSHAQHAARALRALQLLSIGHHKAWIKEAKVDHLLRYAGWMKLFRTQKGFEGFAPEIEAMTATGVKFSVYEREQIRQLEPGLEPIYEKAVLMDETCGVSSPAELTDAYLAMFMAAGGTVMKADVTGLVPQDSGFEVRHNDGAADFDEVVVAAGPWSADVAKW